jgi:hypothetical protein
MRVAYNLGSIEARCAYDSSMSLCAQRHQLTGQKFHLPRTSVAAVPDSLEPVCALIKGVDQAGASYYQADRIDLVTHEEA